MVYCIKVDLSQQQLDLPTGVTLFLHDSQLRTTNFSLAPTDKNSLRYIQET